MSVEIDTLIKPEIDLHDVLKEYLISSFLKNKLPMKDQIRGLLIEAFICQELKN